MFFLTGGLKDKSQQFHEAYYKKKHLHFLAISLNDLAIKWRVLSVKIPETLILLSHLA